MMNTEDEAIASEHGATVNQIARGAREGELTRARLGEMQHRCHGLVNCYPRQPTPPCHPVGYFIAMEGAMGRKIQIELAHAE